MRILRFLLVCLTLTAVAAVLLLAAAFSPWVQTWAVERLLARQPGVEASVGSVRAGLSEVHISDLRVNYDGAVLTLPAAEISLPLWTALWDRKIVVRRLVAKKWTLDLSHRNPRGVKPAKESPAPSSPDERNRAAGLPADLEATPTVVRGLLGILGGWTLPLETSWDGVEVQGEVRQAIDTAKEPIRTKVSLKGGRLGAGRRGEFAVEAVVSVPKLGRWPVAYSAEGQLGVVMNASRTIDRLDFNGQIKSRGDTFPNDLRVSAVAERRKANQETYLMDLTRGDRHVMILSGQHAANDERFNGTWKIDLRNSDVAGLFPGRPLPAVASRGEGSFETDVRLARIHTAGRLTSEATRASVPSPSGNRLAGLKLGSEFVLSRIGHSLQIERLDVSVAGTNPVAHVRCVQPFTYDETTGKLAVTDPSQDWVEGTLQGMPVTWLSGLVDGVNFSGGEATGEFAAKLADGIVSLRSKSPLLTTGVSIQRDGRIVAHELDVSVALRAERTLRGWQWHGAPLVLSSAGRQLASFEVNVAPPADGSRITKIDGTGSADLEALAALPVIPGMRPLLWRSVAGSFAASVGTAAEVNAKLNLVGRDPAHAMTADVGGYADARGNVVFNAPLAITYGKHVAEISAEGTWATEKDGRRLNLELGAVSADMEPLQFLATAWLANRGVTWPGTSVAGESRSPLESTGGRDLQPFWGDWFGRVKFHAYQLRAGDRELRQVTGALAVDRGTLRLEPSRATVATPSPSVPDGIVHRQPKAAEPPSKVVTMEGAVSFDGAADVPYRLEANLGIDALDATQLLGTAKPKSEQCLEARFAVAATFSGTGTNVRSLAERRREEFQLTSKNGILRLLKANVAEAIPEKPAPMADALAGAGTLLGAVLGLGKNSFDSGVRSLPKPTEAVLNFTYQVPEVRYDELAITARRDAGGTIQLTGITMTAPKLRLTGTGRIEPVEAQPVSQGTLELELKLGARGNFADLLRTAGLLSTDQDEAGYTWLREPLHLGGTLEQIDGTRWRDQLLKAAMPPTERPKK